MGGMAKELSEGLKIYLIDVYIIIQTVHKQVDYYFHWSIATMKRSSFYLIQ